MEGRVFSQETPVAGHVPAVAGAPGDLGHLIFQPLHLLKPQRMHGVRLQRQVREVLYPEGVELGAQGRVCAGHAVPRSR